MSKKFGLALGAGGARGVAHVGILLALEEEGIKPDFIAGCSMGAVVGGVYASGVGVDELRDIAVKLKMRDIVALNMGALAQTSILHSKKVSDLLAKHLKTKNIEDFKIKFCCVATDVLSGKMHLFDSGDAALAMRASSAIPGVFQPVEYENKLLVDGICTCRVPIREVKDMGADVVLAVDVLANTSKPIEKVKGIFGMLLRVYDILDAQNNAFRLERDGGACDLLLQPEMEGISPYQAKNLDRALQDGYELAKENMHKIKLLLE